MNQQEFKCYYPKFENERLQVQQDPWKLNYHIMPDSGWLNDPNGLCQFQGCYHVYYQYSPFDVTGKAKLWGHVTSKDLVHWKRQEPVLFPDSKDDCHGVYSGSAFLYQNRIHYFYTGNVKLIGEYDYINEGREQNTLHVISEDGFHFSKKQCIIRNSDYPSDISAHVRDPKIYEKDGIFYMVLGARDKASAGCVLLFESDDLIHWQYKLRIQDEIPFGYMWECPDLFELGDHLFLLSCPQGVKQQGIDYANVHQCGYRRVSIDFEKDMVKCHSFHQLDRGFDFYAPQTFEDEQGRRIMIGWMGLPDIEYENPTTEKGWQHALSIPRILTERDGILYQKPIPELKLLRERSIRCRTEDWNDHQIKDDCFDLQISFDQIQDISICLRNDVLLHYDSNASVFTLSMGKSGYGRKERSVRISHLNMIRILSDTSSLEIFLNDGMEVFSTRVYNEVKETDIRILKGSGAVEYYHLKDCGLM